MNISQKSKGKRQKDGISIETSEALQKLFYDYTHLSIGGRKIACPYWMNNLEKEIYGPIGGKGQPEEIILVTEKAAKEENVDLNKMGVEEIILFMKAKKIGVDCSGFVFWMLDALDIEKGGNGIMEKNAVRSRANAMTLTGNELSFPVEKIEDIKPGDMLRIRRGKHVAMILSLEKIGEGKIAVINYVHSSGYNHTKTSGVHKSKIEIVNPDKDLREQKWLEETVNGLSYGAEIFLQDGDGVRRFYFSSITRET